ncbi:carbohydrate ABC transporter permease [Spirochaeta thermophila]|uniref:Putative permease protein n=1 Tax=Winmispira thermophila (strain ATCC 49972 / DSM 6192 / RI 19.B1) TaxID=665571 RepID=E0RNW3_WINT6|nr:carbohydrate ABC transporter permease [Spirochaeta thermophila]ADN01236.1 putative permease protein [Spirochaeta thermophila DSM 6192]
MTGTNGTHIVEGKRSLPERVLIIVSRVFAYVFLGSWALVTLLPLFWLSYSSFKSNEELNRDIFAFPYELFANSEDEYVVIRPSPTLRYPYDPKKDTRERLIIESTSIAPQRRIHVFFLPKDELPPHIASLEPGDTLRVRDLPPKFQREIHWKTVFFNYISAISYGKLAGKFVNSVIYAGVSTVLIVLLSIMVGFGLSKFPFRRLSQIIGGYFGLGYLLSIPSIIIPLFLLMRSLHLVDTRIGVILVYTAFGLPLGVMLSTQFISGLPSSLVESAAIDGASVFRTFWSVILPMSMPVAVTIAIINGLGIWNEFVLVLVLASSEATKSLPVAVYAFTSLTSTQLGWQLAALVLVTLPVVILYLAFNKRITEGVVAGAIKG